MRRRPGYTLMEVLLVMFVIIILGVAIVPTLEGMSRDSKSVATKDILMSRFHEARAYAIEEVRPYRVWVSTDGKRIKLAPEEVDSNGTPLIDPDVPFHTLEDLIPDPVTVVANTDVGQSGNPDETGWIPIATFLPDGSCRETTAEFIIIEPNVYKTYVKIRGMTGGVEFGVPH